MRKEPKSAKFCIIGAGPSGLATAYAFARRGIPFEVLEASDDIGGLWNINASSAGVYETAHLISSITQTAYRAMPADSRWTSSIPHYPSHRWVLAYMKEFARRHDLLQFVAPGKRVRRMERRNAGWLVHIEGEASARAYTGVVVASGHHQTPNVPNGFEQFSGELIHSKQYRSPQQLAGKRVLVVGAGNSAADVARDASIIARSAALSMRRPAWFISKFVLGFPTSDAMRTLEDKLRYLPRRAKDALYHFALLTLEGSPSRFKMPVPTERIGVRHPTINDDVPRLASQGRLSIKPGIRDVSGTRVTFVDGSSTAVDLIVLATGYRSVVDFLPDVALDRLVLNIMCPEQDGVYFVGFVQPNGSIWRLAELQARAVASLIVAAKHNPEEVERFKRIGLRGSAAGGRRYTSQESKLEVNYYDYARTVEHIEARSFRSSSDLQY